MRTRIFVALVALKALSLTAVDGSMFQRFMGAELPRGARAMSHVSTLTPDSAALNLPIRPRRLRQAPWLREMVKETHLTPRDFVLPVFVAEKGLEGDIKNFSGVRRHTLTELPKVIEEVEKEGIPAVALFPMIAMEKRNDRGSEALNPDGLIPQAVHVIKKMTKNVGVITDVALDPYTSHGQDGLVVNGVILNDETVEVLCKQALVLAQAGADVVAPSDMMDGRIGAIRDTLERNRFINTLILSYAAKYSSCLYGPFRQAVGSAARLGQADKHTYQMNSANAREAELEARLDEHEGADMLMVKPATLYGDIIHRISQKTTLPIFSYHVSGEYSMLKMAASQGCFKFEDALMETLLYLKRAGSTGIFTYGALEAAKILNSKR